MGSALRYRQAVGLCLFDATGVLIASDPVHRRMLGRDENQSIGHSWREWTPANQMPWAERNFQRCLAAHPVTFLRVIEQGGGAMVAGRATLFATTIGRDVVVVGTMTHLPVPGAIANAGPLDVTDYVEALSERLADMAARTGLARLGSRLRSIAAEAGAVTERIEREPH